MTDHMTEDEQITREAIREAFPLMPGSQPSVLGRCTRNFVRRQPR